MTLNPRATRAVLALSALLALACSSDRPDPTGMTPLSVRSSAVASMYALDFVGTAASGFDMNNAGDVIGRAYRDTGCGPFCLPPQDVVVWRGGNKILLPLIPG